MKIRVSWILVLLLCISIAGFVCVKYQWHDLEGEYVTVKEQNMHFALQHYEHEIRLTCSSPNNNPSDVLELFENAVVFGTPDIPSGMLQDPFPW
jgi:hypothetical protein